MREQDDYSKWASNLSASDIRAYDKFADYVAPASQGLMTEDEYCRISAPIAGHRVALRHPKLFTYWRTLFAMGVAPMPYEEFFKLTKEQEDGIPK